MPKLRITRPHNTTQAHAVDLIENEIPTLLAGFGGNVSDLRWRRTDNTFSFAGGTVLGAFTGTVKVEAAQLVLEADIPWAAALFKANAERTIDRWADELFGQSRRNEE